MIKITRKLNIFREISRHIWNTLLQSSDDFIVSDEILDNFEEIKRNLFQICVLSPLGKSHYVSRYMEEPLPFLSIIPRTNNIPIMINRPSEDNNKYWDEPVKKISKIDAQLSFIDYFDWDQFGISNLQYYKVNINDFKLYPHLSGREALVETIYTDVYFNKG